MRDFLCNFIWSCENNVLYLPNKFIIMATLYKIKTVSAFINYNERDITEMFEKFLKEQKFEGTEIDVERF